MMLEGTIGFAVLAGIATFMAPCSYPLLPGYVGYYIAQNDGDVSVSGALLRGLTAAGGVLVVIATVSGVAVFAGRTWVSGLSWLEPAVGVVFVLAGVVLLAGYSPPVAVQLPRRRAGILGFGVFGAGYALAAVACVAPVFVSVFARIATLPPGEALVAAGAYAGTTGVLLAAATVTIGIGIDAWTERMRIISAYSKPLAGALIALAGIGQLLLATSAYGGF